MSQGINYEKLYRYRFRGIDQSARQRVWNEIGADLFDRLGSPARVLDPAAGRCEFINAIPASERWVVDTLDHGEFRDPAIVAVIADIRDADLPPEYFDAIFVSNFLEHLPTQDSVAVVLEKLGEALSPGGRIAVMGPNFKYCAKEYFDCADHTLALTHVAVSEHLAAAGLEIDTVVSRFLPFSFRGFLPPSPTLTKWYLKSPPVWRVLGKQFLVIAHKSQV